MSFQEYVNLVIDTSTQPDVSISGIYIQTTARKGGFLMHK